jgi:hypothetical protein
MVQAGLLKKARPYMEKYLKQKGILSVAQVEECLPTKCKALSSNASIVTTAKDSRINAIKNKNKQSVLQLLTFGRRFLTQEEFEFLHCLFLKLFTILTQSHSYYCY